MFCIFVTTFMSYTTLCCVVHLWFYTPVTFYTPCHVCDVSGVIVLTSSVCVCVCLCVTTLTAKRTDIQTRISVCRSSGRISRSSSKVKVIGQGSRSLGQKTFSGLPIVYGTEYIRHHIWMVGLRRGVFSKRMRFFLWWNQWVYCTHWVKVK